MRRDYCFRALAKMGGELKGERDLAQGRARTSWPRGFSSRNAFPPAEAAVFTWGHSRSQEGSPFIGFRVMGQSGCPQENIAGEKEPGRDKVGTREERVAYSTLGSHPARPRVGAMAMSRISLQMIGWSDQKFSWVRGPPL